MEDINEGQKLKDSIVCMTSEFETALVSMTIYKNQNIHQTIENI